MLAFILFSTVLTFVLPSGSYDRIKNPETGRVTVVENSYQQIDAPGVSFFETILAIPEGIILRADVIALILLIGGCFYVIEKTGALKEGIEYIARVFKNHGEIALILVSLMFLTGGALSGLQEEIIAMTVVLIYLASRLGYNAYVALAISYGSAVIGSAFSPINPFAIGVAMQETDLEYLSGSGFRLIVMGIAFIVWMIIVIRYANRNRIAIPDEDSNTKATMSINTIVIFALLILSFALLIYGILKLDWGFNEMTAEFFILGILAGLIGKLGIGGTSEAYIEGFKEMTFAAMIIGFASSISIILEKGMIIDTIIYGLFTPMQYLPKSLSAISMMISQAILHFPVPSYSGQAVLTMPILAPLSDLIGISRQVCVLAYQYGAVMMDILIPTNGGLMAVLAIAGIPFNKWFKFAFSKILIIMGVGAIAIVIAIYIGF